MWRGAQRLSEHISPTSALLHEACMRKKNPQKEVSDHSAPDPGASSGWRRLRVYFSEQRPVWFSYPQHSVITLCSQELCFFFFFINLQQHTDGRYRFSPQKKKNHKCECVQYRLLREAPLTTLLSADSGVKLNQGLLKEGDGTYSSHRRKVTSKICTRILKDKRQKSCEDFSAAETKKKNLSALLSCSSIKPGRKPTLRLK